MIDLEEFLQTCLTIADAHFSDFSAASCTGKVEFFIFFASLLIGCACRGIRPFHLTCYRLLQLCAETEIQQQIDTKMNWLLYF